MSPQSDALTAMLVKIFRPLVHLLLRFDIPFRTCADALKWTYVDVASREFAMAKNKQTKSRIAVITGLTRIEVERLQREGIKTTEESAKLYNRAARVLSAWESDPEYSEDGRSPKILMLEGEGPNFTGLVTRYSGGATVRAVLDELLAKGNVRRHETEDKYHFVSGKLLVSDDREGELDVLATATSDLLSTIERNLRPDQQDKRLQAYVEQRDMPTQHIPAVREFIKARTHALMDELDALLLKLSQEHPEGADCPPFCSRLGLGFYYFQEDPPVSAAHMDTRGRRSSRSEEPKVLKSKRQASATKRAVES